MRSMGKVAAAAGNSRNVDQVATITIDDFIPEKVDEFIDEKVELTNEKS